MESTDATCPVHKLRGDLPPLTDRIAKLPIDERGYPVPAFVQWLEMVDDKPRATRPGEGKPDFRIVDPNHLRACIQESLCWVCGGRLGQHRAYVIGPMCAINHNSAEPPSHVDCAEWSVKGCPFLSRPNMVRREDELSMACMGNVAGEMIKRNPGVILIWQTINGLKITSDGCGGILFNVGEPESVRWFKEGRLATDEECIEAINSGIEILLGACEGPEERNEVMRRRDKLVADLRRAG